MHEGEVCVEEGLILPDQLFKYLKKEILPLWIEDETFMISSNFYFKREFSIMDVPNDFINDPLEGSMIWRNDVPIDLGPGVSDNASRIIDNFFGFDARMSSGMFHNNVIESVVHKFHMLCFSLENDNETQRAFCTRAGGLQDPYDACLRISDPLEFFTRVLKDGRAVFPDEQVNLTDIFTGLRPDSVEYVKIVRTWDEDLSDASEFRKDIKFSMQKEYRLLFTNDHPRRDEYVDRMLVNVPGIRDLIEVVDLAPILQD